MTNNEIRIAVAELCGWTHQDSTSESGDVDFWEKEGEIDYEPPNYPTSLDACAEFEKRLTQQQQVDYWFLLEDVIWQPIVTEYPDADTSEMNRKITMLFATPLQRCEAFLRLHEKWKN